MGVFVREIKRESAAITTTMKAAMGGKEMGKGREKKGERPRNRELADNGRL